MFGSHSDSHSLLFIRNSSSGFALLISNLIDMNDGLHIRDFRNTDCQAISKLAFSSVHMMALKSADWGRESPKARSPWIGPVGLLLA